MNRPGERAFGLRPVALAITLVLVACQRPSPSPPAAAPATLAMHIEQDGVYRLDRADLLPFGWDLTKIDPARLRLSRGRPGAPGGAESVPFALAAGGEQLRFFGQTTPGRNLSQAVYFLTQSGAPATALEERSAAPTQGQPVEEGMGRVHIENNTTYLPQAAEAGSWLGERLFAPGQIAIPLQLDHPTNGEAQLKLSVWAASEAPNDPDHHLIVDLNGQPIGENSWDGAGRYEVSLAFAGELLLHGDNTLTLVVPGDTGAPADLIYLDAIDLAYPRQLRAAGDALAYAAPPGPYRLSGFSSSDIELWEVATSNPAAAVRLIDFEVAGSGQSYTVDFDDTPAPTPSLRPAGERLYWAAAAPALLSPASIRPAAVPILPPAAGAGYIAITHPTLAAALQPLVEWRQAHGLQVAVVTTDAIADQFGGGVISPDAIRAFLQWTATTWPAPAPRFLLLAGDASYDGDPQADLVPTGLVSTMEVGETASDTDLADLDRDGLPDLAVGRLPARTPAQLQAMVEKTLAYERQPDEAGWQQQALFIADDDDPFFTSFNDQMLALLPSGLQAEKATIGPDADVRARLLADWRAGRGLISYMGHGATNLWAQEEILTNDDIPGLDSDGRLPLVAVWACLSGYFHHPDQVSLGETLLLTPDRGAAAALVPTGATFATDQLQLARALVGSYLFTKPTLGEALLDSYRQLDPASPGQADVVHTFLLLGDPAISFAPSGAEGGG